MAASAVLQSARRSLDRFLIRLLPSLVILAFMGAAVCTVQILRSVLGNIRYEQSAPLLLINCAFLLFLSWAEARSFVDSLSAGRGEQPLDRNLQRVVGWLSSTGWILFLIADRYADLYRARFHGSILAQVATVPHERLLINTRLLGLALVFFALAPGLRQLCRTHLPKQDDNVL